MICSDKCGIDCDFRVGCLRVAGRDIFGKLFHLHISVNGCISMYVLVVLGNFADMCKINVVLCRLYESNIYLCNGHKNGHLPLFFGIKGKTR